MIDQADAVLFATPEYSSSIPGQLKNAIDWASRPFSEIDRELAVPMAHEALDDDGTLRDHDLALALEGILVELVDTARRRLATA